MHLSDFPEMCLFLTQIVYPTQGDSATGKIIVTHTDPESKTQKSLDVPLEPKVVGLDVMEIRMHGSPTQAHKMGLYYNQWFSDCFGYEVILLYLGDNRREALGNMVPAVTWKQQHQKQTWISTITSRFPSFVDSPGVDEGITFADVAPYLVITEKSWKNAQARLPASETLDIAKFRPNIVVEGAEEEFEEDFWAELLIEETLKIVLTQNCARCKSINVDFATGKPATSEAGSMLKKLQKDRRVDPGSKWSPIFGRYGFLDKAAVGSRMRVGDEVKVLKRNSERSVFGECYVIPRGPF
jgi:uncharacterized protein YcbX